MNDLLKYMQVVVVDENGMHEMKDKKDIKEYLEENNE